MPFIYYVYNYFYKYLLKIYLKRDSSTVVEGLKLKVLKGVFHPKLFFSTRYFYDFIKKLDLNSRKFLEIGSGSGLLSLLAARKNAFVTAVDISSTAVKNTRLNFNINFGDTHPVTVLQSDLFANVPPQTFEVIVINPPYFFKTATTESEQAWYCGPNGEYFNSLFTQLTGYIHKETVIYMILADNCDIKRIKSLAANHRITFELVEEKKIKWEVNYIFRLKVPTSN